MTVLFADVVHSMEECSSAGDHPQLTATAVKRLQRIELIGPTDPRTPRHHAVKLGLCLTFATTPVGFHGIDELLPQERKRRLGTRQTSRTQLDNPPDMLLRAVAAPAVIGVEAATIQACEGVV